MNNHLKYAAYMSSGEILECDDFKRLYRAALYQVRIGLSHAALFARNDDHSHVCAIWHGFGRVFTWRGVDTVQPMKPLFEAAFETDGWNIEYTWKVSGLA